MRSAAWGRPGREWPKGESRRRRPGSCELRRERWATPGTGNRAKGFRGAVADQRRRRLSTPGKSERHPCCQRHETPTARGREARSPALIKVAACRSDVHVIPPCRESPRAIDVVRGGIGNPAGSESMELRGFADPLRNGGAFCDVAEPTAQPFCVSRAQLCRYRAVAGPHPRETIHTSTQRNPLHMGRP